MLLKEERELVAEYGRKLIHEKLSVGTFGNISVYNPEKKLMAISPSGMDYFKTKTEDIVVLDLDGLKVDGDRKPSSEVDLHRIFYKKRKGINAVVHTHSEYACTLAVLNQGIPPIHYIIAYAGKEVPCTEYVQFGTCELAESAFNTMGDGYSCILGNHGLLCVGPNISYAFDTAQQVEFLSSVYCRAKALGDPVLLSDRQISFVLEAFKTYRQK